MGNDQSLEQLLLDGMPRMWNPLASLHFPDNSLTAIAAVSLISALILSRRLQGSPAFLLAVCFVVLFGGGVAANWLFHYFGILRHPDFQRLFLLTLSGHAVAALAMLAALRNA